MYKPYFDNLPIAACIADTNGKIKACNNAFVSFVGYEAKQEFLEDNSFSINHVLTNFPSLCNLFKNNKNSQEYDTYLILKDKTLKPIKLHFSTCEDEQNKDLIAFTLHQIERLNNQEINLADERKKYEDIANNSVQLIQSFDKSGQLLFVNNAWKKTFGYKEEEIDTINLFDIISDEDKQHCSQIFENIIKGIPAFDIKANFKSKSGKKITLRGNVIPLLSNGNMIATHAFFNDISELHDMQKELAYKEILIETIFESVPVCLYLKHYEGRYILANEMMRETLGIDVSGKTDEEIFDPENAALMRTTDLQAISYNDRSNNFSFSLEKDGYVKHFFCGKQPSETNDQKNLIFGYIIDITELKNKTAKVEESERILDQIVSNTNTGIMLFQFSPQENRYKLDFLNNTSKKIINYKEELTELTRLLPELQLQADFADTNEALPSQVLEYEVIKSGIKYSYDVYINHLDLPNNDHKLLVFFNDVSEKKQMIENLELRLRENMVLLSEVHHRVKNNLANIYGIIELNRYKFENTDFDEYLIEVQLKIKSFALVHELLYKSKSLSSISLDDYFTELCQEYSKIYKTTHKLQIKFHLNFDKQIKMELSRAINFGLMLGELLSNSLKFASRNNTVEINVSLRLEGERCYMSYSDSGNGFNASSSEPLIEGFGMKLIKHMLKQSKANYHLNTNDKFELSFDFEQN